MKEQRQLMIILVGLCVIGLTAILSPCKSQPSPANNTQTVTDAATEALITKPIVTSPTSSEEGSSTPAGTVKLATVKPTAMSSELPPHAQTVTAAAATRIAVGLQTMTPPVTPTSPPPTSTPGPPTSTPYPYSYAEITIVITATVAELQVGDIVTIEYAATNTGKLRLEHPAAMLDIYFEDGTPQSISSRPLILDLLRPFSTLPNSMYFLDPGKTDIATFTLQAVNPGTVTVKGVIGGLVKFHPSSGSQWNEESAPLIIHVYPGTP